MGEKIIICPEGGHKGKTTQSITTTKGLPPLKPKIAEKRSRDLVSRMTQDWSKLEFSK